MNARCNIEPAKSRRNSAFRLAGLPIGVALVLTIAFALVGAGAGSAKVAVAPSNTAPPTISGTPTEGQLLTAATGIWSGTSPITYTQQWQRCDSTGGSCSSISGATAATYTLKHPDVDNALRVEVTATNADGKKTMTSVPTAVVKAATVPTVSLASSASKVVYGTPVTLSGAISASEAGESVTIQAQHLSQADTSFSPLATVATNSEGGWSYTTKPTVQTTYQAHWNEVASSTLRVGVHPLVAFHVIVGNRFSTKVVAGHGFPSRIVQLQRRSSLGQWVTVKRVHLNAKSVAIFRATLPKGTSRLRIAFSVNQAGPGYLGGLSRTIVYHHS